MWCRLVSWRGTDLCRDPGSAARGLGWMWYGATGSATRVASSLNRDPIGSFLDVYPVDGRAVNPRGEEGQHEGSPKGEPSWNLSPPGCPPRYRGYAGPRWVKKCTKR